MYLVYKTNLRFILYVCIYFSSFKILESNSFSALVNLKDLLETEKKFKGFINLYFEREEERLQDIKKSSEILINSWFSNTEDAETFLSDPLKVFRLVSSLTKDIEPLLTKINQPTLDEIRLEYLEEGITLQFTENEDFDGAAHALNRLANSYHLNISKIANGEIFPGVKSVKSLSAHDCFEIGRLLQSKEYYLESIAWFEVSLAKEENEISKSIPQKDILELLSRSYYKIGNVENALKFSQKMLEYDPANETYLEITNFLKNLNEGGIKYLSAVNKVSEEDELGILHFERDLWRKLCGNETILNFKLQSRLKCYYSNMSSHFLYLQPVKIETIHEKPWLVLFHDIIRDDEIEVIKELAIPKLNNAGTVDLDGSSIVSHRRVSKSSWIDDNTHPAVARLSNKLEAITGLDIKKGGELLQVVNYGIGGHYKSHFDFTNEVQLEQQRKNNTTFRGNRIATILIYMSKVLVGGGTIFPRLGIHIQPIKGSAVFWYNLKKNGEGNMLSQHAACPVLIGDKWAANKWVREFYQEFRKPCGLNSKDTY